MMARYLKRFLIFAKVLFFLSLWKTLMWFVKIMLNFAEANANEFGDLKSEVNELAFINKNKYDKERSFLYVPGKDANKESEKQITLSEIVHACDQGENKDIRLSFIYHSTETTESKFLVNLSTLAELNETMVSRMKTAKKIKVSYECFDNTFDKDSEKNLGTRNLLNAISPSQRNNKNENALPTLPNNSQNKNCPNTENAESNFNKPILKITRASTSETVLPEEISSDCNFQTSSNVQNKCNSDQQTRPRIFCEHRFFPPLNISNPPEEESFLETSSKVSASTKFFKSVTEMDEDDKASEEKNDSMKLLTLNRKVQPTVLCSTNEDLLIQESLKTEYSEHLDENELTLNDSVLNEKESSCFENLQKDLSKNGESKHILDSKHLKHVFNSSDKEISTENKKIFNESVVKSTPSPKETSPDQVTFSQLTIVKSLKAESAACTSENVFAASQFVNYAAESKMTPDETCNETTQEISLRRDTYNESLNSLSNETSNKLGNDQSLENSETYENKADESQIIFDRVSVSRLKRMFQDSFERNKTVFDKTRALTTGTNILTKKSKSFDFLSKTSTGSAGSACMELEDIPIETEIFLNTETDEFSGENKFRKTTSLPYDLKDCQSRCSFLEDVIRRTSPEEYETNASAGCSALEKFVEESCNENIQQEKFKEYEQIKWTGIPTVSIDKRSQTPPNMYQIQDMHNYFMKDQKQLEKNDVQYPSSSAEAGFMELKPDFAIQWEANLRLQSQKEKFLVDFIRRRTAEIESSSTEEGNVTPKESTDFEQIGLAGASKITLKDQESLQRHVSSGSSDYTSCEMENCEINKSTEGEVTDSCFLEQNEESGVKNSDWCETKKNNEKYSLEVQVLIPRENLPSESRLVRSVPIIEKGIVQNFDLMIKADGKFGLVPRKESIELNEKMTVESHDETLTLQTKQENREVTDVFPGAVAEAKNISKSEIQKCHEVLDREKLPDDDKDEISKAESTSGTERSESTDSIKKSRKKPKKKSKHLRKKF